MKKTKAKPTPTPSKYSLLRPLCNLIPEHLGPKLARETKVDEKGRPFSAWSHGVALLFAPLTHAIGLNAVCDALGLSSGPLAALRGATPPSRNNLSHAHKHRDAAMAEQLFRSGLDHLKQLRPRFAGSKAGQRLMHRFHRVIHGVDSTPLQRIASRMDWAKQRRRKAAAKGRLRLDWQRFLPRFALIDTAQDHDNKRAQEVCAGVRAGESVIFDKAYVGFVHLLQLPLHGVFWVTRAKDNLDYRVVRRRQRKRKGNILRDAWIELKTPAARQKYPQRLSRGLALVELDGRWQAMALLTNNLEWGAQTMADLSTCRGQIEVFFQQSKQTLPLADFLGQRANAVKWQVWLARLTCVRLRFLACLHQVDHGNLMSFMLQQGLVGMPIFEHMLQNRDYCSAFHAFRRLERAFMGSPVAEEAQLRNRLDRFNAQFGGKPYGAKIFEADEQNKAKIDAYLAATDLLEALALTPWCISLNKAVSVASSYSIRSVSTIAKHFERFAHAEATKDQANKEIADHLLAFARQFSADTKPA